MNKQAGSAPTGHDERASGHARSGSPALMPGTTNWNARAVRAVMAAGKRPQFPPLGFSLIELTVVMVVTGILAAVFIPRTKSDAIITSTQAEQFAADIRYVQSLAMNQGWSGVSSPSMRRYRINYTATTYSITDASGVAVTHPSGAPSPITLGGQVNISPLATAPLLNNLIAFDGLGKPYTDATAATALASTATLSLVGASGTIRAIQIYPETGLVRLP